MTRPRPPFLEISSSEGGGGAIDKQADELWRERLAAKGIKSTVSPLRFMREKLKDELHKSADNKRRAG